MLSIHSLLCCIYLRSCSQRTKSGIVTDRQGRSTGQGTVYSDTTRHSYRNVEVLRYAGSTRIRVFCMVLIINRLFALNGIN
jgi:hypothetical protein